MTSTNMLEKFKKYAIARCGSSNIKILSGSASELRKKLEAENSNDKEK